MTGLAIGYRRVSTDGQNTDRQLDGVALDRCYDDQFTGASSNRPALTAMLAALRGGDVVHVHSIDRLARSIADLDRLVREITATGATLKFHKENLVFTNGGEDPFAALMLHVLGAFAQFERSVIRGRAREGIALAKAAGRYKGGKPKLSEAQVSSLNAMLKSGVPVARAAKAFGITRPTVYRYRKATS